MQKFTIFTIIFSVIVITVVAELVVQDYLEKLYPPPSSLQANVANDDFEFFYPDQENPEEEPSEDEAPEDSPNKVLEILEENRIEEPVDEERNSAEEDPVQPNELDSPISTRVETLLPALSIPDVEYKPGTFNGKVFNLVTTEDLAIRNSVYGFFQVDIDVVGSFYELETKNNLIAESTFKKLKTKFNEFPEIEINQNNQFGDQSFYINHAVKVNEVFIVIQKDNFVYAFAYQNQFHDVFKAFFGVLL